jgi:hypothetical protein
VLLKAESKLFSMCYNVFAYKYSNILLYMRMARYLGLFLHEGREYLGGVGIWQRRSVAYLEASFILLKLCCLIILLCQSSVLSAIYEQYIQCEGSTLIKDAEFE